MKRVRRLLRRAKPRPAIVEGDEAVTVRRRAEAHDPQIAAEIAVRDVWFPPGHEATWNPSRDE
jgi:hypothetical protein